MTDTFDWAGLWSEAADIRYDHGDSGAAAFLRTRIEAAFVPRAEYDKLGMGTVASLSDMGTQLGQAQARAEAAEAWPTKALDLIERVTLEWNETYRKTGTDYAQGYSDCAGVLLSELEKLT